MEAVVNKRCLKCIHRIGFSNPPYQVACGYLLHEGKCRPCPAGKECTEFVKGKAIEAPKSAQFSDKVVKKCKRCGIEFKANPKRQYCDECVKLNARDKAAYYADIARTNRRATEYEKEKVCILCDGIFHSARPNAGFCPECKKIPSTTRRMKMRRKNQWNVKE